MPHCDWDGEDRCHPARRAALAIANGWSEVSFDRTFERFDGLVRLPLL
jgi:hypothetical protein